MKITKKNMENRTELVETIIQAYMKLFVEMQFNVTSHWLMFDLTFAQARAVVILAVRKSLTVSQLAEALGVGNSTASILIQQLVEKELVTRREHPDDRRHTLISLSKKGAEIGAGRRKERETQWQKWLNHLNDNELSALASGLTALTKVIHDESEVMARQMGNSGDEFGTHSSTDPT